MNDKALAARDAVMSEKPKTLIQKLAEVALAVERVPKRGRNDFHGYDYATEADIAEAVRKEMATRHLVMFPNVVGMDWRDGKESRDGKATPICVLNVEWTIKDGESDAEIKYHVPGAGQDSGDKGPYKALTGSQKYALLKLLQIPTGDDPEREDRGNGRREIPGRYKGKAPKVLSPRGDAPPADEEAPFGYTPEKLMKGSEPPEISQVREALRLKLAKLADLYGASPEQRREWAMTYLNTTDTHKADPAALQDLVKFLEQKCREKGVQV